MKFTVSGKEVVLRDFVPHGVVASINEALFHGVTFKPSVREATLDELRTNVDPAELTSIAGLPKDEAEKKLAELRKAFPVESTSVDGLTYKNVEEANLRRVLGMVVTIDGKEVTKDMILNELSEPDFQAILAKVEEVSRMASKKK